jgi:hypothetical protein
MSRSYANRKNPRLETAERKQRGLAHPILLLDFAKDDAKENQQLEFLVLGTTATTYSVRYNGHKWNCTCPDFQRRQKFCKHIYFVIARVLQRDVLNDDLDEKETRRQQDDIDELYLTIRNRMQQQNGTIKNPEPESEKGTDASQLYKVKQRDYIGEVCCFCLDPMTTVCPIVYCESECGKTVHKMCFQRYVQTLPKKNEWKCPYCRSPMRPASLTVKPKEKKKMVCQQL